MSAGQGPYGGGPQPAWGPPPGPPQPQPGVPPQVGPGGPPQPGWPPQPAPRRRRFWFRNPVAVARVVCKPSRPDRVDDPAVRRIQILRVVAGLLAMVWILVSYRIASDAQAVATQRAEQMANSAALLAVTFPVIVGVFLAASRPPRRSLYLRRARGPLGALLSMGAMIVYMVLLTGEKLTGGPFGKMPEQPDGGDYLMLVYQLVLTLVAVWGIGFVLWGAVLSVIHVFRTTDIHEVLPPLIAIVLVWELSLLDLFSSAYDSLPTGVWLAAVFGGPLSVTAVSLWELRRLRTRHGLTIRGALGR